jgi:hypothetical protein
MANDNTYNGWTNYATWRVNLEIFDGLDPREMGWRRIDTYDLGQALKSYAHEVLEIDAKEGLALDYARAFISDVNWYEIARHMRDEYDLDNIDLDIDEEEAA